MLQNILTALALVLVIEGITPFINPGALRRMVILLAKMDDHTLRIIGLSSMLCGVLLLYLVN